MSFFLKKNKIPVEDRARDLEARARNIIMVITMTSQIANTIKRFRSYRSYLFFERRKKRLQRFYSDYNEFLSIMNAQINKKRKLSVTCVDTQSSRGQQKDSFNVRAPAKPRKLAVDSKVSTMHHFRIFPPFLSILVSLKNFYLFF